MQRQSVEFKRGAQDKLYDFLDMYPDNKTKMWSEFNRWRSKQNRWSPELITRTKELAKSKTQKRAPDAGIGDLMKHHRNIRTEAAEIKKARHGQDGGYST